MLFFLHQHQGQCGQFAIATTVATTIKFSTFDSFASIILGITASWLQKALLNIKVCCVVGQPCRLLEFQSFTLKSNFCLRLSKGVPKHQPLVPPLPKGRIF